jgi:DNA-binding ferritin-like protein (Dps family)
VFALRNVDGDVEDVYGPDVDPFSADAITDQENARRERLSRQKKLMDLESKTTHTN